MVKKCLTDIGYPLVIAIGLVAPAHAAQQSATSEALWQRYLKPQSQWPARAQAATDDLAALPDPKPLRDQLNRDRVALGKKLFHDTRLSATGEVSCASCHDAAHAFADPRRVSIGVKQQTGKRNAPALMNSHLWESFFWDGRAASLKQQAAMPVEDPVEMAHNTGIIARQVAQYPDYRDLLAPLTRTPQDISWELLAESLAEFQRTLMDDPKTQPLDSFLLAIEAGDWQEAKNALTDQQLQGLHLFRTKAGCIKCHNGPLLSDQRFHNTGLHYFGRKFEDLGRYEITGKNKDMGAFRTPSLRHLMATKPWMHNGLFTQLEGIIRMYEHGGARPRRPATLPAEQYYPTTTQLLTPFDLTPAERQALMAFIKAL